MKINLKSYLGLLRIQNWRGYFLIATFGFVASKGFLSPLLDIIIFWVIILLFLGFGFSINDCFDTEEDKFDKSKKNPITDKRISFRGGLFFSIFLAILGLTLSIAFGLKVFLFFLAGIMLAFFYSSPPLRLKSRPLLDLISHGLFAGAFIFLIPLLIFHQNLTLPYYLIAFSFFYLSVTLELRNHLEDYKTDKKAGLETTVCALGHGRSEKLLRFLAAFYPLSLFPVFWLTHWQYFSLFLIFTALFLFFLLFRRNYRIVKNYRIMDAYAIPTFSLLLSAMA